VVIENLLCHIQQMEDLAVPNGVEDIVTLFPTHDNIPVTQNRQLLRQIALFNVQASAQVAHPSFGITQGIQDAYPKGVRQRFEEFGLELTQFRHPISCKGRNGGRYTPAQDHE
jgi:hypothetical protein